MFSAKEKKETLGDVAAQISEMVKLVKDESRAFSADELNKFQSLEAQAETLKNEIATAEAVERGLSYSIKAQADRPQAALRKASRATQKDFDNAFRGWALSKGGRPEAVKTYHYEAAEKCGINLSSQNLELRLYDSEALVDGDKAENTLAVGIVEKAVKSVGGFRNVARMIYTDNANTFPVITVDSTANTASARAKLETVASSTYTLGRKEMKAFSYGAKYGPVANETLADSGLPIQEMLLTDLGEMMGRLGNSKATIGEGTTEPLGIANAVTPTWLYPSSNVDLYDVLHTMKNSLDPAWLQGSTWMFHPTFVDVLESMVDGIGRPMWRSDLVGGIPGSLFGFPYVVNADMPEFQNADGKPAILFGRMDKFYWREVKTLTLSIDPYTMIGANAVNFYAFSQMDTCLANSQAIVGACAQTGSIVNCGIPATPAE